MAYGFNPNEAICEFTKSRDGRRKLVVCLNTQTVPTAPDYYEGLSDEQQGKQKPLEIFTPWSRIMVCMDDTPNGGVTKRAFFKLPIEDFRLLKKKTEPLLFVEATSTPAATVTPKAFTEVPFSFGTFNGKTPSQVLLEKAGTKEQLLANREWLAKRTEGRKDYMALIESIDHALSGPVQATTATPVITQTVAAKTLFEGKYRSTTEKNSNGKNKFYDFAISFDPSRRYAITISATNYFATLTKRPDGTQSPDLKSVEGKDTVMYYMTVEEFWKKLDHIDLILKGLYYGTAPKALECARTLDIRKKNQEPKSAPVPSYNDEYGNLDDDYPY